MKRNTILRASVALTTLLPAAALAAGKDEACKGATLGAAGATCTDTGFVGVIGTIVNTLLFLVGALAVIVIIFGGVLYVTSAGNAKRIEQAKNTIIYAVGGLIVAILAYAIVNFVVTRF